MATVTSLGVTFTTSAGSQTVTATPAVGDLIVIVVAATGFTTSTAPTDNKSGTYTKIASALKNTSADILEVYVRTSLISAAASTIFTYAPSSNTGGGLQVFKITGMSVAGTAAIVQSQTQANQAASTTPAPVLGATPRSVDPIIGSVFNATSPATMTPRTGYTESNDSGYSTPTTGMETMFLNSGETSATITWGSTSASAFSSVVIELNVTPPAGRTFTELPPPPRPLGSIDNRTAISGNPNLFPPPLLNTLPGSNMNAPIVERRNSPLFESGHRSPDLLTSISENPNLYTSAPAVMPPGVTITDLGSPRPYGLQLRTDIAPNLSETDFFVPLPPGQTTLELPPRARVGSVDNRTAIAGNNPDLYTNPVPVGTTSTDLAPPTRSYTNNLRTWINENPLLYANPVPTGVQIVELTPRLRAASIDRSTWLIENPNIYVNPFPVGITVADLPPPARQYIQDLRSGINENPNLYTNPIPVGQTITDLAPPTRKPSRDNLTSISENPNLQTQPLSSPIGSQIVELTPPARPAAIENRTDISENANLYTNQLPIGATVDDLPPATRPYPANLRTWIGPNQSEDDYFVPLPPGETFVELPPPSRPVSIENRTDISGNNPDLYTSPFPVGVQETDPYTPARPYIHGLRTDLNQNPNLYTNPVPAGQTIDDLPPAPRTKSSDQRTAIVENPDLYTNPFPAGTTADELAPAPRPYRSNELRTWISQNPNLQTQPAPTVLPPGVQTDDLAPAARSKSTDLRTWVNENPNLYTNPFPVGTTTVSLPPVVRPYVHDARTWICENPNLYPPPPVSPAGVQTTELPPPARSGSIDRRTWISGNDPETYTNPVPAGATVTELAPPARPYAPHLRTWIGPNSSETDYVVPLPPGETAVDLAPPTRPYIHDIRTWISENPNLYSNPVPTNIIDLPTTPQAWRFDPNLRTSIIETNPNLFVPPPPFPIGNQYDWPTPPERSYIHALRTWVSENADLYSILFRTPSINSGTVSITSTLASTISIQAEDADTISITAATVASVEIETTDTDTISIKSVDTGTI